MVTGRVAPLELVENATSCTWPAAGKKRRQRMGVRNLRISGYTTSIWVARPPITTMQ